MSFNIDLSGKVALVTGGNRGIGRAVSKLLAKAGASIAIAYGSDAEAAALTCCEIAEFGGHAYALQADLTKAHEVKALINDFEQRLGRIDILVANAGVWEPAKLEELDPQRLRRTFDINVAGLIETCRQAAPLLEQRGWGRIIVIGSTAGIRGEAGYSQYAASKGAVHLFAKSIAVELAPKGVHVNTVAPGWVRTDMTQERMDDGGEEAVCQEIPRGKIAEPEDVAGAVLFLCSELSNHIVGATISVNGGSVLD